MITPGEVRALRSSLALRTGDVAHWMGVHRRTIERWEAGTRTMGEPEERLYRAYIAAAQHERARKTA